MKKKILAVSLAVALIAICVVSGTLAWFSDTDEATNTFTIGSVEIVQNEKEHNDAGELVEFTQDQYILPVGDEDNFAADENYIEKIVTVTSTGENEAYVRTFIAVPTALEDILVLDINETWVWVEDVYTTQPTQTVDGVEYTIRSWTHQSELGKDVSTDVLLKGVYLKENVDLQKYDHDNDETTEQVYRFCTWNDETDAFDFYDYDVEQELKVLVATQGVQAQGFENADSALDSAFPEAPTFTAA